MGIFTWFKKDKIVGGSEALPPKILWIIWDVEEQRIACKQQAAPYYGDLRQTFGGPWRWDIDRYKFIRMDILVTLHKLDLHEDPLSF